MLWLQSFYCAESFIVINVKDQCMCDFFSTKDMFCLTNTMPNGSEEHFLVDLKHLLSCGTMSTAECNNKKPLSNKLIKLWIRSSIRVVMVARKCLLIWCVMLLPLVPVLMRMLYLNFRLVKTDHITHHAAHGCQLQLGVLVTSFVQVCT